MLLRAIGAYLWELILQCVGVELTCSSRAPWGEGCAEMPTAAAFTGKFCLFLCFCLSVPDKTMNSGLLDENSIRAENTSNYR